MNPQLCDVTVVLDRSGSMATVQEDTIGGFNTFVDTQKNGVGKCLITLVQFDDVDPNEVVMEGVDVNQSKPLTKETYIPRGGTPLLDAIGRTIVATGIRLSKMADADRPSKVVFVILTDGHENSSKEYTAAKIKEMIKHQQDAYQWQFVFLGANQDAIAAGGNIGINANNSMTYAANSAGTRAAFTRSAGNLASYRATGNVQSMVYSKEQREEQVKAGA